MDNEARSFSASVDSLEPIREFISQKCDSVNMSKKKNYGLCLAIDEIATNIIKYGYPKAGLAEGEGIVEVIVDIDEKRLSVTLEDSGIFFDPLQQRVPDEDDMKKPLEERPIGGLGILLARQNVDEFNYQHVDGKNINIFTINIQ